jgi:hypothetical protein
VDGLLVEERLYLSFVHGVLSFRSY